MAALFRNGLKPPPKVLEIIVRLFHRLAHPLYLGVISLEIGWSLARTQEMLDALEDRGVVRPMTVEEKVKSGYRDDAILYVLTEKPRPGKAWV